MIEQLRATNLYNPRVLAVMAELPRHLFVEEALKHYAYNDNPLPIGSGQTISAPSTQALVTSRALCGWSQHGASKLRVLEIGAGSGYHTALLRALFGEVLSFERVRALKVQASRRLRALGFQGETIRHGDGLKAQGPASFDIIIVSAAIAKEPLELRPLLRPGGRLLIPLGDSLLPLDNSNTRHGSSAQALHQIDRTLAGRYIQRSIKPAYFVPLLHGAVYG